MPETYSPIIWHNDTFPAINENNLNRIEVGVEALDDRIARGEIGIADPVAVPYATAVTLNATLGSLFRCDAAGDITLDNIVGGTDGQTIVFEVFAAGGIGRTLSFTGSLDAITVAANQLWSGTFRYRAANDSWYYVSAGGGSGGTSAPDLSTVDYLVRTVIYTSLTQIRPTWAGSVVWIGNVTGLGMPVNMQAQDWVQDTAAVSSGNSGVFGTTPFGLSRFGGGTSSGTSATEAFALSDGAPWPTPWTTTGGSADVTSGAGRLFTAGSFYAQAYAWRDGPADGECVLRWRWTAADAARNFTVIVRGGTTPGDNPKFEWRHNGDSLWLRRSGTLLASQVRSFSVGTWYSTRVKWFGNTIQGRTWLDGATEPTSWDLTQVDLDGPLSGNIILRLENGDDNNADTVMVDSFVLLTA